jgi:hypothetical protein
MFHHLKRVEILFSKRINLLAVQGGSDKSGVFFFFLLNGWAQHS